MLQCSAGLRIPGQQLIECYRRTSARRTAVRHSCRSNIRSHFVAFFHLTCPTEPTEVTVMDVSDVMSLVLIRSQVVSSRNATLSLCLLSCYRQRHRTIDSITINTMSNRPRSLHELAEAANYNLARFPELPDLANGAHEIMRLARLYEDEKDLETAYILFRRAYT
jgi:hypothetical protein